MKKSYKEKYNTIIDSVENCFQQQIYTVKEIVEEAQKTVFLDDRQLLTVFEFLTEMPFREYVGKRRLGAVFAMRKKENCSWEDAAIKYGYSQRSAFDRAFKNGYQLTPAQALECKEIYILQEPLYFDKIQEGKHLLAGTEQFKEAELERKTKEFHSSYLSLYEMKQTVERLNRIDRNWEQHIFGIADAQTYYGLSLEQAAAAFAAIRKHEYFEAGEVEEDFFCGTIADYFTDASPEEIEENAELIYVMTMLYLEKETAENFIKEWHENDCGALNALDEDSGLEYGYWYEYFRQWRRSSLFLQKVSPLDFAWLRRHLREAGLSGEKESQYALNQMMYDDVSREITLDIRKMINGKAIFPQSPVQREEVYYIMAKSQCRKSMAEEILNDIRENTDMMIQQMDDAYLALLSNEEMCNYLYPDEADEDATLFSLPYQRYLSLKEKLLKEYDFQKNWHPAYMPKQLSQKEIAVLLAYMIIDMVERETSFEDAYDDAELNFGEMCEAEQYGGTQFMLMIAQRLYAERSEDGSIYPGRIDQKKKKDCIQILARDYQKDRDLISYMDRVKLQIEDGFYDWILESLQKEGLSKYDCETLKLCVEKHINRTEAESLMRKLYKRKELNEMKMAWGM